METIKNLLVNALEGGSNYWYFIEDHNKAEIPERLHPELRTAWRKVARRPILCGDKSLVKPDRADENQLDSPCAGKNRGTGASYRSVLHGIAGEDKLKLRRPLRR